MRAERRYLWRDGGAGTIEVLFEDGRFFHRFDAEDPEPAAEHDCPPDRYRVRYDFRAWPRWRAGVAGHRPAQGLLRWSRPIARGACVHERLPRPSTRPRRLRPAARSRRLPRAPNPDGLLHAMQACLADPSGKDCTEVDRARGFVIIKDDDPAKPKAWLIVPDHEVTGIESPAVFRPPVADFWRYGWQAGARLLPRHAAGRPGARDQLEGRPQPEPAAHPHLLRPPRGARRPRRRRHRRRTGPPSPSSASATTPTTSARSPRSTAARSCASPSSPAPATDMGEQSLAVTGSADGGFFLLTDSTEPGVVAEAEELLDETCGG